MTNDHDEANLRVEDLKLNPNFYEVDSLDEAKRLTVSHEPGMTSEVRWCLETPFLVEEIGRHLPLEPDSVVLDYGCGTGRISKGLIEKHGCRAVGVDTSKSMRLLSPEYVLSERFTAWSPEVLDKMIDKGFRADHCVCLWVLQHALDAAEAIGRIERALWPGGRLFVLNATFRCLPTDKGMVDDRYDVQRELRRRFAELHAAKLPATVAPPYIANNAIMQVLQKAQTT